MVALDNILIRPGYQEGSMAASGSAGNGAVRIDNRRSKEIGGIQGWLSWQPASFWRCLLINTTQIER
jgi:hypothetical protein